MSRTRVLAVLVLAAVVAVSAYSLPLAEWTTQLAERARGTGAWGVALFFTAYVISTVAFLPGSVLTLAAGFAYGPLWGVAIASPASVIGSTCAFLLGRTLLRLSPIIPFNALNYALSLSKVKVRTYVM
ncbi:MAG: hypothetical protein M3473_06245, partial [Chloroflexota bacterium]|nr:hypothetical protein [Chloroflexota bacterium]